MRAWLEASELLWQVAPDSRKPYFWHHYTFEYMLLRSRTHRKSWNAVPKMSANPVLRLQECLMSGKFNNDDWATIDASPMQKLTYKKPEVTHGLSEALDRLESWRTGATTC